MVKRGLYKWKDANILGSRESSQLFNFVKMQTKSERCQDAMISYVEVVVNCLNVSRNSSYVVRKIEGSWRSFKELRRIWLDFGITMVVKLEFDFENFSIGNGQPRL
jgi:hypothetical protein